MLVDSSKDSGNILCRAYSSASSSYQAPEEHLNLAKASASEAWPALIESDSCFPDELKIDEEGPRESQLAP